jgi:hypothetical protein
LIIVRFCGSVVLLAAKTTAWAQTWQVKKVPMQPERNAAGLGDGTQKSLQHSDNQQRRMLAAAGRGCLKL